MLVEEMAVDDYLVGLIINGEDRPFSELTQFLQDHYHHHQPPSSSLRTEDTKVSSSSCSLLLEEEEDDWSMRCFPAEDGFGETAVLTNDGVVASSWSFVIPEYTRCAEHAYRQRLPLVHGILYPPFLPGDGFATLEERVDALRTAVHLRAGDVVIATFPKCGTTLIEQIVLSVLNHGDESSLHPLSRNHHSRVMKSGMAVKYWPEDDIGVSVDLATFDAETRRRVIKTHAPHALAIGLGASSAEVRPMVVYVTRNPMDAAVSMYHHARREFDFTGTITEWIKMACEGTCEFGSWFEHTRSWWRATHEKCDDDDDDAGGDGDGDGDGPSTWRPREQHLWMHFEDIVADPPRAVRTVADFLGVNLSPVLIQQVADSSSFDRMKRSAEESYDELVRRFGAENVPGSPTHFRRGKVGGWRSELPPEDAARLRQAFDEYVGRDRTTGLDEAAYTWE